MNNQTRFNQAPPLPPYYVERPEVSEPLKQILLSQETAQAGTVVVSAIYGLGGIGKSTLAAALAHDQEVQSHFTDGIFWATLGQQPDILSFLSSWLQQLGDYDFKAINIDSASLQLRTLLSDKKALLVVDDVWHPDHVEPFRVAGDGCRVLVTTREAQLEGAIPYDLDVMTPNQSLELLTACFNNELTDQELDYAETLAKTVGYLPLALELAAAQVRDGLSWQELLGELEDLIVGVEALDRLKAEEEPSDAKRKNYSLVASFNLSLKGLFDDDRLKNFAWLGILPEDVTITESMATTLWDCNLVEAKDTLRYLRQKALLLPGLSTTPETNYRLHDLLHDLARSLVQAELGLSITEAHQQLLERYQTKTEKGLWHTLPDDGYIYNHLIWHLEKAKKINDIHQLLTEETPAGDNGWYWQCERQGKTANFIKDVSRAWAIAAANFTENPTESISLQCRYALITTSLNSLAGNIGPKLMAALLENNIWTPAQALAYVRQNKDSSSQVRGLEGISEYLPPSLLSEALEVARAIRNRYHQANALIALAPHFPEVLPETLDCVRRIGDEYYRALAFRALVPHLPHVLLPQALDSAKAFENGNQRAIALRALAPHLPHVLLPQALDSAKAFENGNQRAIALRALAPHFPEVLPEALDFARAIRDESDRVDALGALAVHFPEVLPEALDSARAIRDEADRVDALGALAVHFPEVLPEALDGARALGNEQDHADSLGNAYKQIYLIELKFNHNIDLRERHKRRAKVLNNLAPDLPEVFLPQALEVAKGVRDEYWRADALIALTAHFPEVLPEALNAAKAIQDEEYREEALKELASHLPEVLLHQALDYARGLGDEQDRAEALILFVFDLPEVFLDKEVLRYVTGIGHEYLQRYALIGLVPHFPELLPETLDYFRALESESERAEALIALAPHFPQGLLPEALDYFRALESESKGAGGLIALALHFSELLPEALDCAKAIRDQNQRADVLIALAPYLPELLPQALDLARGIRDEYKRANALITITPHFPEAFESLRTEALQVTRAIRNPFRANAFIALAPHLPELLPEALDLTRGMGNQYKQADDLITLAPHLPQVLLPQALYLAKGIRDKKQRADALIGLAPYLPDVLLQQVLDCIRAFEDKSLRANTLIGLAPHLPDVLLQQVLDCIRAFEDKSLRANTLIGLAPHLPDVLLQQALDDARGIRDEYCRALALGALVPHLPELLPKALDSARAIRNQYHRAYALIGLAPHLPELLPEALDSIRSIPNPSSRAYALIRLAPHFPEVLPEVLECVRAEYDYERVDLLIDLAPHLPPVFLGQALDCAKAIQNRSWRANALGGLEPYLPEVLLPEALNVVRLDNLLKKLNPSLVDFSDWQQLLNCLASLTRPQFLKHLPQLAPLIIELGGVEALRETVAAVEDVSRWWR
ncbi:NB-ARC domain-containing protein [Moorena sp. SIO3H5]|uniref:NB-ARC domain-containing protein n=1 Tax=Moorena sp. SIO3H5 TaxID=2607834 RepID=UPI0013BCF28D|nr:NB-ARC domain-containing protein [Moorena sp. SIO3H5]NEO69075.1 hypothetical protein [Moorena sp. SIO3H5]